MISITNADIIRTNTMTSSPISIPASASATLPDNSKKKGYLELILGPMFSGKTSTLKKIYDQCMYCSIPVMVINYSADKRYSSGT